MKFLYFTLILATLFMLASQAQADCTPTSCNCLAIPNGLFCGDGNLGCVEGHVYQCGSNGKDSCDFGVRDSCVKCNKLQC